MGVVSLITDRKHSKNLNTFRSVIDIKTMSSSSNDELPDIPGTRFPWMEEEPSTSRNPHKSPKRLKLSARKKKSATMMDTSSDDDFIDPKAGPSKPKVAAKPLSAEECKRLKKKEYNDRARAKQTPAEKQQERQKNTERTAAARANETPEQRLQRKMADAERHAATRANETAEQHLQRNQANAQQTATARTNETPAEHPPPENHG